MDTKEGSKVAPNCDQSAQTRSQTWVRSPAFLPPRCSRHATNVTFPDESCRAPPLLAPYKVSAKTVQHRASYWLRAERKAKEGDSNKGDTSIFKYTGIPLDSNSARIEIHWARSRPNGNPTLAQNVRSMPQLRATACLVWHKFRSASTLQHALQHCLEVSAHMASVCGVRGLAKQDDRRPSSGG